MAGGNDLASLPNGTGKLWIMPVLLELFAFPFAWISVQMLHDREPWSAIAEYALTGMALCITGVLWAVFRKRIAEWWPWHRLRIAKAELAKALAENEGMRRPEPRNTVASAPSKLVIQSADYRAIAQGGNTCDVTECLQKMIKGDSLILQIENHNFVADGKNYVPVDPYYGELKRLRVVYYFDGGSPRVAERPEHKQIVLPEDMFLIEHIAAIQHQVQLERNQLGAIISPLQIEALTLAKELRDYRVSLPPFPRDPQQHPDEEDYDYITRVNTSEHLQKLFQERREQQQKWRAKVIHTYANRGFGPRITSFLHRFAEHYEDAPIDTADYAENLGAPTDETIPKIAQQIEMLAIWINRKERGEVNLLK